MRFVMSHPYLRFGLLVALKLALFVAVRVVGDEQHLVGLATEKRFPPLAVSEGFHAALFVAHDSMSGLGNQIVRHDDICALADTDDDGSADRSTKSAGGPNSVQGRAYSGGAPFVMHAPLLTSVARAGPLFRV